MRLKNIVLTSLINERLIAYEELERVMNATHEIATHTDLIKNHLKKIVKLNAMINEWQEIMQSDVAKLAESKNEEKDG